MRHAEVTQNLLDSLGCLRKEFASSREIPSLEKYFFAAYIAALVATQLRRKRRVGE